MKVQYPPIRNIFKATCLFCCVLCLGLIVSCKDYNPFLPVPCSNEWVYGLHIEIRDAATGDAVGEGATVTIYDGDFEETTTAFLLPGPKVLALAAGERPGVYEITVALGGYKFWRITGIRVKANVCHVIPVDVLVELEEE